MERKNDFTTGSIPKKLTGFMVPILGALILQAMYGAVDILVVGQFGSTAAISGVSTGSAVVNLMIFTITGLAMGVTIQIGRYIGEGREKRIGKVIGGAIALFSTLSVLLAIFMVSCARPLATLMQAPPEALSVTITYVRICGGGIFFIIAYNLISSIFRGLGDSKNPLLFVGIACVFNIIGDLFFVAVMKWDVAGAALATVMAQALSVILSLIILRRQTLPFTFALSDIGFNSEIPHFIKLGIPIAFQEIMTQLSFLALCAFINRIGIDASNGYGIANKLVSFILLLPSALMQSMSSFVAQNVGAAKEDRAKKAMQTGMLIGCATGVFIALFTFFKGDVMSAIFTHDPRAIARSFEYLRGFALESVVTSIMFSYIGYFNGHEKTLFVMLQGLAQTLIVRLPVSYFMSIQPNASLTMIGLAAPDATIFGIIINTVYFVRFQKQLSIKN